MAQSKLHDLEASAQEAAGNDTQALKSQLEAIKGDVAQLTELLGEIGLRRKDETLDAAKARYKDLRAKGEAQYDDAQRYLSEQTDQAVEAVRRQPLTALGIAVGIGFVVGLISRR